MNTELESNLKKFFDGEKKIEISGSQSKIDEFQNLPEELRKIIPDWYKDVLINYPLNGLLIEYNDNLGDQIDINCVGFEGIQFEFFDVYPGCAIGNLGFICIGECPIGSGNPYFISIDEGKNPPVYQIYHDVSDIGEKIVEKGKSKIVEKLSDLFKL